MIKIKMDNIDVNRSFENFGGLASKT